MVMWETGHVSPKVNLKPLVHLLGSSCIPPSLRISIEGWHRVFGRIARGCIPKKRINLFFITKAFTAEGKHRNHGKTNKSGGCGPRNLHKEKKAFLSHQMMQDSSKEE